MRIEQAVILAGGLGKRLGEKSLNCPKPMQLIDEKPFLDNIIWNLKRHDIKRIVLSVGYLSEKISHYYRDGSSIDVEIIYVNEDSPAGTGGALKLCSDFLDEYFLLINGDTLFDINYHDLAKSFPKNKLVHIALNFVQDVSRYGEVTTHNCEVISFKEKGESHPGYINSGVSIMNKKILDYIQSYPYSLEIDLFPNLISKKLISSKKYDSFFLDIGIPETLKAAEKLIPKWKKKSVLFLDRDGVVNFNYGYVHSLDNFELIPNALETIKLANDLGFLVIIITNQAGIARGFYSEEQFQDFSNEINNYLIKKGAHIDATYYCPHHPSAGIGKYKKDCECRKPKPGMIEKAIIDWEIEKENSFLIGDNESDIIAAKECGINGYLFSNKNDNLLEIFKNNISYLKRTH